jgi:uncharacterized protein (TIGR03437 family)
MMSSVSLMLERSKEQQAALEGLLNELQKPGSPSYHRWLTPEQFAERFGVSQNDAQAIKTWLEQQGFQVDGVARGRNWVTFSGSVAQMERTFRTEIHRYQADGEEHIAAAVEPSIPEAFAPVVKGFVGLDDFLPRPSGIQLRPLFDARGGNHYLVPDDLATIYDIAPLYSAGIDGTGQSIAIVGASDIDLENLRTFRATVGLPPNDPQIIFAGPDPGTTGAMGEANLDLEWAGAIAPNATIFYVEASNVSVAELFAVDQNVAPVISASYFFSCEQEQTGIGPLFWRAVAQQANAQGITWVNSSGDAGAAACDANFSEPLATKGPAVRFPASIPEITAVGGTEFAEDSAGYWNNFNDPGLGSALTYIPEVAWNDSLAINGLGASGGGASVLFGKPAWQAGPGVPDDNRRDLPDIAMAASPQHDGYLVCANQRCFYVTGGTSASAPVFAGILALVSHYLTTNGIASAPGLGNVNPTLYRLAQTSSSVFHDIVSGDNIVPCAAGTPGCDSGSFGYSAGPGYDMATGLGSVDAYSLAAQWNTQAAPTVLSLTASSTSIAETGVVTVTATVQAAGGPAAGTVTLLADTATLPIATAPLTASGGAATAAFRIFGGQLAIGPNTITAVYGGSNVYSGSAAQIVINETLPTASSAVVLTVSPNPVFQAATDADGYGWFYTVKLSEIAGVATTLTDFRIDDISFASQIPNLFGQAALAANGQLTAALRSRDLRIPVARTLTASGKDASGFTWTQQIPVYFYGLPLTTFISGGGNAASGQNLAAPGMLLRLAGSRLAPVGGSAAAGNPPWPVTLNGVSATVNGVPAPISSVAANQVVVQVPYETTMGNAVLTLSNNGATASYSFAVNPAAPGIFGPAGSGSRGQPASIFITGDGIVTPALADGDTPDPSTPPSQLPAPQLPVNVWLANLPASIQFVGIPSGMVGQTRIDFTVPANAPTGLQPLWVTVGSATSPAVPFAVTE